MGEKSGRWRDSSLAALVQRHEEVWLRQRLPSLPGETLLWIDGLAGEPVGIDWMQRVRTHVVPEFDSNATSFAPTFSHRVVASVGNLPFASSSYRALVVRHAFEFSENLHVAVNEVSRVLELGGQMIVLGFNPMSSWGLRSLALRRFSAKPFSGRFVGRSRLTDLLQVLGFRVLDERFALYRPPLHWLARLRQHEPIGNSSRGVGVGALYFVQARKEGFGMTLIRPTRRPVMPRRLVPAIVKRND